MIQLREARGASPRSGGKLQEIQEMQEISSCQSGECDRSLLYRQEKRKVRGHVGGELEAKSEKERRAKKRPAEGRRDSRPLKRTRRVGRCQEACGSGDFPECAGVLLLPEAGMGQTVAKEKRVVRVACLAARSVAPRPQLTLPAGSGRVNNNNSNSNNGPTWLGQGKGREWMREGQEDATRKKRVW